MLNLIAMKHIEKQKEANLQLNQKVANLLINQKKVNHLLNPRKVNLQKTKKNKLKILKQI
jgi:hypothetical protein